MKESGAHIGTKLTCYRQGKHNVTAFRTMLAPSDHETMFLMGVRGEQNKIHFPLKVCKHSELKKKQY